MKLTTTSPLPKEVEEYFLMKFTCQEFPIYIFKDGRLKIVWATKKGDTIFVEKQYLEDVRQYLKDIKNG